MEKKHAVLLIAVGDKLKIAPGISTTDVQVLYEGCEECLFTALTVTIVRDERFRKLINRAGIAANKIRKGEIDKPDFHHN